MDHVIADGNIHKFQLDPKDTKKSGWYVCHQNHTRGGDLFYLMVCHDWRSGGQPKKFHTIKGRLSQEDKDFIQKQTDKAIKKNDDEKKKEQEKAAIAAEEKWNGLELDGSSEYLIKKQISQCPGLGIRYDNFSKDIYVPVRDPKGKLTSLQKIQRDGSKRFFPGGRVAGCFHILGDPDKNEIIYICEGFATAASVFYATGVATVCAFDSGKLPRCAKEIWSLYQNKKIIICGDDDTKGEKNTGRLAAEEAAKKSFGRSVFPDFFSQDGDPSDFNDLHCRQGIEEVVAQLQPMSLIEVNEPMSMEQIMHTKFPDEVEKNGRRKGTWENFRELIRRVGITVKYNLISKKESIVVPGDVGTIDNQANSSQAHILSWCERCEIPTGNVGIYITRLADKNPYNPVATWIDSEPWDGQSRLEDLYETIQSKNEPLKKLLMRKWLISAVAAAYRPDGVSAAGVLVLQGKQNIGKTNWTKHLAPAELDVIKDGAILRPDDKDSVFGVISKWIVELGELDATFRKSDMAQLKAFLTQDKDSIRRPYARTESYYARRTVFVASVNETQFLNDPTGNRRFWTIECESIDHSHCVNMQQLWAEVKTLYDAGETWYLTPVENEMLSEHNSSFETMDPIEEMIESAFAWNSPKASWRKLTAAEVAQQLGITIPTNKQTRDVGTALRKRGIDPKKNHGIWRFEIPLKRESILAGEA